jgi:hypothetical protein
LTSTCVRGIWLKDDLLSDLCPHFEALDIDHIDLKTSVMEEWRKRNSIRNKRLEAMRKAREDYEKELAEKLLEEQEAKLLKKTGKTQTKSQEKDKKAKPKQKKVKSDEKETKKPLKSKVKFQGSSIPPVVDEALYIDVDDEYLKYEKDLIESERESFSPKNLELEENEVIG